MRVEGPGCCLGLNDHFRAVVAGGSSDGGVGNGGARTRARERMCVPVCVCLYVCLYWGGASNELELL